MINRKFSRDLIKKFFEGECEIFCRELNEQIHIVNALSKYGIKWVDGEKIGKRPFTHVDTIVYSGRYLSIMRNDKEVYLSSMPFATLEHLSYYEDFQSVHEDELLDDYFYRSEAIHFLKEREKNNIVLHDFSEMLNQLKSGNYIAQRMCWDKSIHLEFNGEEIQHTTRRGFLTPYLAPSNDMLANDWILIRRNDK